MYHHDESTCDEGILRFRKIKIGMLLLTLPHSKAAKERVFSMVIKSMTYFRLDSQAGWDYVVIF